MIKNLPTQTKDGKRKLEKIKQKKGLRILYLLDGSSDRLSRSTMFLC